MNTPNCAGLTPAASARALIAFVDGSPEAVMRHDRAGWIALFADDCLVEDPVGSRPHHAGDRAVIGRFYDTFIAPNQIVFHRGRDYIDGLDVLRDLSLEIRMAPGVAIRVPMFLVYELADESGALRIKRLAAHWELPAMVLALLRCGIRGVRPALALGVRMLRLQGVSGTLGFLRAWSSVGAAGKKAVLQSLRDDAAVLVPAEDGKLIAAGDCVSLRVRSGKGEEGVLQVMVRGSVPGRRRLWLQQVTHEGYGSVGEACR